MLFWTLWISAFFLFFFVYGIEELAQILVQANQELYHCAISLAHDNTAFLIARVLEFLLSILDQM